ncbi:hypothetical protein PLESTB_001931400 [Pleodorina starrii]|uniref:Transposase DDE domain-containing protein n=1 Tax=Pleodorina starrii TaxID=330485 RepID=A0A9W6C2X9_9CHLO|nr:hypothetical protein PLESTB_001931400 [Pleodorina starrii]
MRKLTAMIASVQALLRKRRRRTVGAARTLSGPRSPGWATSVERAAEAMETEQQGRALMRAMAHDLSAQQRQIGEIQRGMAQILALLGDLLLDRFFLVTSISRFQMKGQALLDHYRQRGKAEGHMGELMDVLSPALSSTNRAKTHLRGKKPKSVTPPIDAFACNEVRLLVAMLAYQIMHVARRAMARATKAPWSLRRLRERVLRAGARLIISARRMTLILAATARALLGRHLAADPDATRGRPIIASKLQMPPTE